MVSKAVVSTLLVIYGLCMLAEKTQASFPHFYSHSDVCNMQHEKSRACKKFVQQRSEGGELRGANGLEEDDIPKQRAPLEIELRLDSQQLEIYRDVVDELLNEEAQKP
ncbi:promotilin [Bombina bombina]|uniref:promotilin n=1 Tax=Bombina bombina TaxID=8345 RepID=UPI00235B2F4F|nr:promotilin [Bombina bombina]